MTGRSEFVMPSRRGFLSGLLALVATPAIVRAASLMPVSMMPDEEVLAQLSKRNSLLTINKITREGVRLWKNSNKFLENIDTQYDDAFARSNMKIDTSLRICLPYEIATSLQSRSVLSPV